MPNPANWAQLQRTIAGTRHAQFVRHLVKSFDLLFFVHVVIIYLHDISTFRFLLRALVQMVFLSPHLLKVRIPPQLNHRPIIGFVIITNLYCILRHAFHSFPHPIYAAPTTFGIAASSSSSPASGADGSLVYKVHQPPRNILHGGLTIEFVGAPPFASAWPFLVLDTCVLALQLIVFALNFADKNSDDDATSGSNQPPGLLNENEPGSDQVDNNREEYQRVEETARILRDELQHGIDSPSSQARDAGEGPSSARPPALLSSPNASGPEPPSQTQLSSSASSEATPPPLGAETSVYESYSGNLNVRNIEVFHTIARSWTSHERYWAAHGGRPTPLSRAQRRRDRRERRAREDLERGGSERSSDEESDDGAEAGDEGERASNRSRTAARAQRHRARRELERTLRFMQESMAALEGRRARTEAGAAAAPRENAGGPGVSPVSVEEFAQLAELFRIGGWPGPAGGGARDGEPREVDEAGFDSSSEGSAAELSGYESSSVGSAARGRAAAASATYGSIGETVMDESGMWGSDESDDDLYAPREASESSDASVSDSSSEHSREDEESGADGHRNVLSTFMNSVIP